MARGSRGALARRRRGLRQRLRAESSYSWRDGAAPLAGVLAVINLAVAVAGITEGVEQGIRSVVLFHRASAVDWWWIAFTLAAAGVVLGLVLGDRRIAVGAVFANLGLVGYDAIFLADNSLNDLDKATWTFSATYGRR